MLSPLADRFVGYGDATFEHEFLYVAVAQGEAIGEPDPVTDDFAGKAVVFVTLGVCGWGHAWLPILVVDWSWEGITRSSCHGSGSRVHKLTKP